MTGRKAVSHYLRTEVWSEERREAARQAWRARNPERAAVRDQLLASVPPEPCDRCGDLDVVLWVTDYDERTAVWRCRPCAREARA